MISGFHRRLISILSSFNANGDSFRQGNVEVRLIPMCSLSLNYSNLREPLAQYQQTDCCLSGHGTVSEDRCRRCVLELLPEPIGKSTVRTMCHSGPRVRINSKGKPTALSGQYVVM